MVARLRSQVFAGNYIYTCEPLNKLVHWPTFICRGVASIEAGEAVASSVFAD